LTGLQTGVAMEPLQVGKGLQQSAASGVLRSIPAVTGSNSGLRRRWNSNIIGFKDDEPVSSRRVDPSEILGGTLGLELWRVFISPRCWREAGEDGLRQIVLGEVVRIRHTAGKIKRISVRCGL